MTKNQKVSKKNFLPGCNQFRWCQDVQCRIFLWSFYNLSYCTCLVALRVHVWHLEVRHLIVRREFASSSSRLSWFLGRSECCQEIWLNCSNGLARWLSIRSLICQLPRYPCLFRNIYFFGSRFYKWQKKYIWKRTHHLKFVQDQSLARYSCLLGCDECEWKFYVDRVLYRWCHIELRLSHFQLHVASSCLWRRQQRLQICMRNFSFLCHLHKNIVNLHHGRCTSNEY